MRWWQSVGWIAAVLIALPAPGALAQKKGTARQKARVEQPVATETGDPEAPTGLPERFRLPDSERTRLAAKKRDESIEGLKRLLADLGADNPQRAEMFYRLSELYWEKSQYLLFEEMAAYDRALAAFDAAQARGEKVSQPKADHTQSRAIRAETMRLYRVILADYPEYRRLDEVLFNLAYNLYDLDQHDEAIRRYQQLIDTWPESKFAGDAWVQLGNHHFESGDVIAAQRAYEAAARSDDPRIASFATYRLAWCDYNTGEYRAGLTKLQQVVARLDAGEAGRGRDAVNLRTEAMNDSVRFFVQLNVPDEAQAYYRERADDTRRPRLLQAFAAGLAEAGYDPSAIAVYRSLLREAPMSPAAPMAQQGIVRSLERLRQRDAVREELLRLARNYGPSSPWWEANAGDDAVLKQAFQVTEEALRTMVTEYHREAQKTKEVDTYRIARDIYATYVEQFASSDDPEQVSDHAFNLRFYYAEILWALEEWEPAAQAYQAVLDFGIPDRELAREISNEAYRQQAAYNAVLAWEQLVRIERGQAAHRALRSGEKIKEQKKPEVTRTHRIDKERHAIGKARDLTQAEQALVAACDTYNARFPGNPDELDVRYQAAILHYEANQMMEAIERFGTIIERFPADSRSQEVADLSMDILNRRGEWKALNELSRGFLENRRLWKPGTPFARRLASVVEGSQYKWVDEVVYRKEKNPARAAELFMAFVDSFPTSDNADRALTYVMFIAQEAQQRDRAVEAGERVLRDYRGSAFELKVRYTLAGLYAELARFEQAAKMYESFLATYETLTTRRGGKPAPVPARAAKTVDDAERESLLKEAAAWRADARYNAGIWWEGLGEDRRAIAAFEAYVQDHPKREDRWSIPLRIAGIHEQAGRWKEALAVLESFERSAARSSEVSAEQRFLAGHRQAEALLALGREDEAQRQVRRLLKEHAKLSQKARADAAVRNVQARLSFLALEPEWKAYTALTLSRATTMVRDLKAKQQRLASLKEGYTQVLGIGDGEWGIAALTRLGLAYADLAERILGSPEPRGLNDEQLMMYRTELENVALPLEDEAAAALELALSKAYELKMYGEWTLRAQEQLNRYRHGAYAQVREVPLRQGALLSTASLIRRDAGPDAPPEAQEETPKPSAAPRKDGAGQGAADRGASDVAPLSRAVPAGRGDGRAGPEADGAPLEVPDARGASAPPVQSRSLERGSAVAGRGGAQ